ncbi:MAG: TlyA family rRNA (cytidine-2'-O)-methyltransferase [Planctomycetota bacterium]|nr:TlyA family rRNA (cytidine-2'-O)-methyltransferase [Planctomycetota bacterium]
MTKPRSRTEPPAVAPQGPTFVSRGGLKLHHALTHFGIVPTGWTCADLGCSTGGFTDCLLQAGAARVHSVDTAYGELAWKLRNDPRVVVTERTNALHAAPPQGGVELVVVDMSWAPQRRVVPAALRWLNASGRIITLIKPHYELKDREPKGLPRGGVLDEAAAQVECQRTLDSIPALGATVLGVTPSPILGGAHKGKGTGNVEYLALLGVRSA